MVPPTGIGEVEAERSGRFRRTVKRPPARPFSSRGPIPEAAGVLGSVRRDLIYRRTLVVSDLVSAAVALGIGLGIMGGVQVNAWVLAILPVVVLVSKMTRLYDRDEHLLHKTTLDEIPALFQVSAIYVLLLWLGSSAFLDGELNPDRGLGLWGLLFVSMVAARSAGRRLARRFTEPERCIVVGPASSAAQLQDKLALARVAKANVVGRLSMPHGRRRDDPPAPENQELNGIPVLGGVEDLGLILAEYEIERAVIAPGASYSDEILDVIRLVKSVGVKVSVLPRLFEVVGSSVEFDDVEGVTLLGVRRYGLSRSSRALKRGMDLVGASLGLLALAPLFLIASVAIKLTSPGPVFFRQKRIGRDGREFEIFKFRTMEDGADARKSELLDLNEAAEGLFKIPDDPRITRVGRFLRRSSLDELPQLINVLRGDMSLVGPRPLIVDEDRRIEGWHRRRLHVMPGMTGFWQVLGSSRIPLHEMVKIDYLYGANWSLWMDVKILLRTVPYVLNRRAL